jgi:DNA-directed RNA polymerase alpha subunit
VKGEPVQVEDLSLRKRVVNALENAQIATAEDLLVRESPYAKG